MLPAMTYRWGSLTRKKADRKKKDSLLIWYWERDPQILWTTRKINKQVLEQMKPETLLWGAGWQNWSGPTWSTAWEGGVLWKRQEGREKWEVGGKQEDQTGDALTALEEPQTRAYRICAGMLRAGRGGRHSLIGEQQLELTSQHVTHKSQVTPNLSSVPLGFPYCQPSFIRVLWASCLSPTS